MSDLTPGTWTLDPAHTSAAFTVRHAGISKARGQFTDVEGELVVAEGGEDLAFTATLKTESVSTSNPDRDAHLKSADFFDVENNPTITFRSTELKGDTLHGELTINGITKPVELDFAYEGAATDPFGIYRAGFTGETTISRKEFGLTWNAPLKTDGVLVSEKIKLNFDISATKNEA